ncbi:MAG: hypothetical protein LUC47_08795 [Clostridiales bacterium]|nr:hypothetical protein [Clostridiales bacterium]
MLKIKKQIKFEGLGNRFITIDEPTICPLCHHVIKPQELNAQTFKDNEDHWFLSTFYLCGSCYQTFVALFSCQMGPEKSSAYAGLQYVGPKRYEPKKFDARIEALSPRFVKIYNQALEAETSELDEIAGLGYRKATEFLIKDFCIHRNPTEKDKIRTMPLSACIKSYIDSPDIQTLATRTAWLGNDEAHYVRKHIDKDVQDMKSFIEATAYFIGMSLIVEEADSMTSA